MSVEELVKELREQERSLQYNAIEYGCVDSGIAANVASQAADKLEELAAALAEKDNEIAVLRKALDKIANWPNGGNNYGQENIKRFARRALEGSK